ncbi:MAG TPA: TolC family protein, partial [Longimicrobiales bacterium]|nr:TolC family protein [Longimicrobiales bacterium]
MNENQESMGMMGIEVRPRSWTATSIATLALALALAPAVSAQEAQGKAAPLGLEQLARRALETNRELRAAREGLVTAQEQVSEAWSNVYPSIDLNASYSRNISPNVNFLPAIFFDPTAGPDEYIGIQFGADNQWTSSVTFEQPLFRPSVFVAVGAAGRFEDLQEESVRGTAESVVTQVRLAYYQLLLAQEQVRLTENSLERVRQSLRETRALNQAGLASDYDVLRLEVELANLEPNLRRAENAVRQARRQLAIHTDIDDQDSLRVRGTLAEIDLENLEANSADNREILGFVGIRDVSTVDADEAVALATERRSDLQQLELTEELRRAEMRAEQATYLPELTLFGSYNINAQDNGSPNFFAAGDGQRAYSRIVGLRFSLPIFQGFRRDARIDQRRASLRQAQAQTS